MERIAVIYNPNSRKNRARSGRAADLQRIVGRWGEVLETRDLGELRPKLRGVLDRGVDYLVADGGDGSLHWVLNETKEVRDDDALPPFVPTNGGTIDFVARKTGLAGRSSAETILRWLTDRLDARRPPPLLPIDSLELSGVVVDAGGGERRFRRIGFALAAGGIGQRFFDKYYAEPRLGPPAIVKVVARAVGAHVASQWSLPVSSELLDYGHHVFKPTQARVCIDGQELDCREHGAIHAGAFDVSLGGLFRVFPLARDPGALHFQAGAITPGEIIRALPDLVRGAAIRGAAFTERAGAEMRIEAIGEELLAPIIDGERLPGVRELVVRRGPVIHVPKIEA
jgi:hypothetical protein